MTLLFFSLYRPLLLAARIAGEVRRTRKASRSIRQP
jgi:hypothetical protein